MSPNDIEVLMHCHCSPDPLPRRDAPAVRDAVSRMMRDGIIELNPDVPQPPSFLPHTSVATYATTKKGAAFVKLLCDTPYPSKQVVYVDQNGKVIEV